jgi:hypothetical protein
VICQIEKSFICVRTHDNFLLVFDQHAVDERIRVERLMRAVGEATTAAPMDTAAAAPPTAGAATAAPAPMPPSNEAICRVAIKPIVLKNFNPQQLALLATPACRAFLARFYFDYQLLQQHGALLVRACPKIVDAVPDIASFLPRLLLDFQNAQHPPHRGGGEGNSSSSNSNGGDGTDVRGLFLPSALLDTLNSRACRFAIMFHTRLSRTRCKALLYELATTCAFPFQCAHGRPSCVPLLRLGGGDDDDEEQAAAGGGRGGGVMYDIETPGQGWRRPAKSQRVVIPLRFRRGLRTVHLRRFGKSMRREREEEAMGGGGLWG